MSNGDPKAGRLLVPKAHTDVRPLATPPTFSIVIPVYQAADTVGRSLRTAMGQLHPALEVIVIDDGSTDDLESALRPFDGQIKLIRKDHRGAAAARNAGAAAASGEFLAILDADDAFHPRRLQALAELACARPDLDLITTDTRYVVQGKAVGSFRALNPFAIDEQRAAILRSCFVGGWPAVRLSRLREVDGFDESLRIGHDWDCWLRLILDGSQAGLIAEPYYDYALHAGSVTANRVASLWDRVRLLEKAALNPALSEAERPVLASSLRRSRTRAVRAEAKAALFEGGPRNRLREFPLSSDLGLRTRLLATLTMIAPALARRLVSPEEPPRMRSTS